LHTFYSSIANSSRDRADEPPGGQHVYDIGDQQRNNGVDCAIKETRYSKRAEHLIRSRTKFDHDPVIFHSRPFNLFSLQAISQWISDEP